MDALPKHFKLFCVVSVWMIAFSYKASHTESTTKDIMAIIWALNNLSNGNT